MNDSEPTMAQMLDQMTPEQRVEFWRRWGERDAAVSCEEARAALRHHTPFDHEKLLRFIDQAEQWGHLVEQNEVDEAWLKSRLVTVCKAAYNCRAPLPADVVQILEEVLTEAGVLS